MSIRRPFQLPGRAAWYIDINRKRRSLGTNDYTEALKMYNEIVARYRLEQETPRLPTKRTTRYALRVTGGTNQ